MPTQIIDGFRINAATPIDTRMVTKGASDRAAMKFKYEGLRVYDTSDKKAYVWIDGAWKEESSGVGGGGGSSLSGTDKFLVKFSGSNGAANSVIYDASPDAATPRIGIGTLTVTNGYALEVSGNIKATSFKGTVSAGDVTGQGLLNLNVLKTPTAAGTYVLKSNSAGNTSWQLESTTSLSVSIANDTSSTGLSYITFTSDRSTLNLSDNGSTRSIAVLPATQQLLASSDNANQAGAPGYSFLGNTNTGLFASSTRIGISLSGTEKMGISGTSTEINTNVTIKDSYSLTVGGQSTLNGNVSIAAGKTLAVPGAATIGSATITTATVTGNATIGNNITVAGLAQFNGNTSTNSITVNGDFSYRKTGTSVTPGHFLKASDGLGLAVWSAIPDLTPYGVIMMWPYSDSAGIPAGWKACAGTAWILIGSRYRQVPDFSNKYVAGNDGVGGFETIIGRSPTTNLSIKLTRDQIPSHAHTITGASMSANITTIFKGTPESHGHTFGTDSQDPDADGTNNLPTRRGNTSDVALSTNGTSLTPKGYVELTGRTNYQLGGDSSAATVNVDGTTLSSVIIEKCSTIILTYIIKINPDAAVGQQGRYTNSQDEVNNYNVGSNSANPNFDSPSGSGGLITILAD